MLCLNNNKNLKKMKYSELFFLSSFSQSNIYNFTFFNDENEDVQNKEYLNYILIFSLKPVFTSEAIKQHCELISIGSNNDSIHSLVKPMEFPELSAMSEVLSIDSYVDNNTDTVSIILCFIKKETKPKSMVHIYDINLALENEQIKLAKLKDLSANLVFKKDIGFNPLHSTHTNYFISSNEKLGSAFILSISEECLVHSQKEKLSPLILAFVKQNFVKDVKGIRRSAFLDKNIRKRSEIEEENRYDESASFQRKYVECLNYNSNFPEFSLIKQKILIMDFKIKKDVCQRIGCFGSECGDFLFSIVNMKKSEILVFWNGAHNSPITSLHLINDVHFNNKTTNPSQIKDDYHLLVCSAIEEATIYKNVSKNSGFSKSNQLCLMESEQFDCVLCSIVADIDMDGELEVLVGCFLQYLLIYKWYNGDRENDEGYFKLVHKIKCAGPVYAILHTDFTRDGIKELIVLTGRGLHIYQLQPEYVASILLKRISL